MLDLCENSVAHQSRRCDEKGELPGIGDVWVNDKVIANILGFKDLKEKYFIYMNTEEEDEFVCKHKVTGKIIRFPCSTRGLYEVTVKGEEAKQHVSMPQTLKETSEGFSDAQVSRAKQARALQHTLGVSDYKTILKSIHTGFECDICSKGLVA